MRHRFAAAVVLASMILVPFATGGAAQETGPYSSARPFGTLRLLTARTSDFQGKLLAMVAPIMQEEIDAGRIDPPLPLRGLAYLTSRITETFVYADTIEGETPDPAKVRQAIRALLRD